MKVDILKNGAKRLYSNTRHEENLLRKKRMITSNSSQGPNGERSTARYMKWTNRQDEMLIHFMREMCKQGKSIPGGFTAEGWNEITKEMKMLFGPDFHKDKLKNRCKTFKKWYREMKAMISLSGFSWDEEKKMVTAESRVWDDYIVAHPEATLYRSKCFPDYYGLCEIFSDLVVDGREGFAMYNPLPLAMNDPLAQSQQSPHDTHMGGEDEFENIGDDHISTTNRHNAGSQEDLLVKRREDITGEAMIEMLGRMADALDRLASTQDPVTRMRMCWEALDPLDIEERLKFKALAILEGEAKAATFLALPLKTRKLWLLGELGTSTV